MKKAIVRDDSELSYLLDQLEKEYLAEEQGAKEGGFFDSDEFAMYTYAHVLGRSALYWVNGEPTKAKFPASFQGQRLAKACEWMKTLARGKRKQRAALQGQIQSLRRKWPKYREECGGLMYSDEILETTWDGLVSAHDLAEDEETKRFLPKFHKKSSEDLHLIALSVIFLNRKLGNPLLSYQQVALAQLA